VTLITSIQVYVDLTSEAYKHFSGTHLCCIQRLFTSILSDIMRQRKHNGKVLNKSLMIGMNKWKMKTKQITLG